MAACRSAFGFLVSQAVILQWVEKTTSLGNCIYVASVVFSCLVDFVYATAAAKLVYKSPGKR